MHLNLNLMKDGKNIFADEKDAAGLSKEAYYFIGGLMEHMKAMTVIFNPLVNSYKRLVPGYEAPVYTTWSSKNRSHLIRVVGTGKNIRVELRSPDPAANPYFAIAAALMAGLDGIRHKTEPPKSVECSICEMTEAEKKAADVYALPDNLSKALEAFEGDSFMKEILGEHAYIRYMECKSREWNEYKAQVTEWEVEEYLYRY